MHYQFNNVGVAQLQAHILALPEADRQLEINALQADIVAWLMSKFAFSPTQLDQLMGLPDTLLDDLAAGMAAVWGSGGLIGFYKDPHPSSANSTTDDRDQRKGKDVLYRRGQSQRYAVDDDILSQATELQIWIT